MLFHYSTKKLLSLFLIRFIPSLIFLYIALWVGEVFWIATILLWVEAIIEIGYRNWKGYCKITEDQIHFFGNPIFPKSVHIEEVYLTLSYDDEWTFRTKEKEIRIDTDYILKKERADFDTQLKRIRISVDQKKHLINTKKNLDISAKVSL